MTGRTPIPFIGAFESTYQPVHDRDVLETTAHPDRWREDLLLMRAYHVSRLRYPLRWHRIEREPGVYDWGHTDEVLGHMHDDGFEPIVDLLHHTSYPLWLGDFASPEFGPSFLRFVEAVAERYPWLPGYTVCNEPFTTFLLCGQLGVWPPHGEGFEGFIALARNMWPAITEATRTLGEMLPDAQHFHVEACERHTWSTPEGEEFATMTNDRRFLLIDLLVGRDIDRDRPFVRDLVAAGGADLLEIPAGRIDVLGLDYYAHNQWHWSGEGVGTSVSPCPVPLAELMVEYAQRYEVPVALGETNIRGFASDRATWLKYTLEQCERARDAGVDVRGYCWFPFIDSADWGSLLAECEGAIDPVGVFWLDENLDRRASSMSVSFALAAGGVPSVDLPAYELRPPVSNWLAGWLPQMSHWDWRPPPVGETCSSTHSPEDTVELRLPAVLRELVVLSHLRWTFVWQRPQHLISRLAADYERTWFVEEPEPVEGLTEPVLRTDEDGPVTRVWLQVPAGTANGFDADACERYAVELIAMLGQGTDRTVWLYTPMALPVADALEPSLLVYDVMDDLAAFRFAPRELVLRQHQALRQADIVFSGGRSLHRSVLEHRPTGAYCSPSGVEPEHYATAITARARRDAQERPVAGYVGVIDERIDLELVAGLAAGLPDWEIRMVGPVLKIDPETLPTAPNITYPGPCEYAELPAAMARFDVALMPFALNAATKSISPTKTLEYLAAGLPVVSTRVPDVVADYTGIVELRDDAEGFAEACVRAITETDVSRAERVEPVLWNQHWDTIASRMTKAIESLRDASAADVGARETA